MGMIWSRMAASSRFLSLAVACSCMECALSFAIHVHPHANGVCTLPRSCALIAASSPARACTPVAEDEAGRASGVPVFLDIGTKGGVVFYTFVGIVLPFFLYGFLQDQLGMGVVGAGNVVLVGYVGLSIVGWTGSYVFRVANKDMTYAKQLRDYENAVIQKRFEELSTDEVDALMGEISPEKPSQPAEIKADP